MENENYYLVIFKEEIIGVINEKELIELEKEDRIRNNKNINIAKIAKSNVNDILKKDLIKALDRKESKKLKEKLFIMEIVQNIKEQLLVKRDMDIVIPEKAYQYISKIETELKKQGISLQHPLRECINDLSPYSLFEDMLKRDKEKSKTNYLGRERE